MAQPAVDAAHSADTGPDMWQLIGLPGALHLANYLTATGGPGVQYRLIVDVLLERQQHSLTGIAHDELADLLHARLVRTTGSERAEQLLIAVPLRARMAQLGDWGVVDTWDERPERDEDFLKNSSRYQLTALAARFHRGVTRLAAEDVAGSVAATFAPLVLRTELEAMRSALGRDPGEVAKAWAVVSPTLNTMAEAAAGWQARLAGALAGAPDPDKVQALQDTLRRYVDMWGAGVDTHSEAVAAAADDLLAGEPGPWRAVALHAGGADATDAALDELTDQYTSTLRTVQAWFGGRDSQARRLRRQMRDAIAPMVRGQRTLAAVGGHVSRRAELLRLAGALEAAPDDTSAWRLWCTATGLFSARHLALGAPQPGGQAGTVSFWDAAPAPIEMRLRRRGPRALTGRPARIVDRTAGRQAARAMAAAQREAEARTRAGILARTGQRLSQWANVTAPELEVLLGLLAAVTGAPASGDGTRITRTGDGLWHLRADPPRPDASAAVLHTPTGRLVHPDIRLHIGAGDQVTAPLFAPEEAS